MLEGDDHVSHHLHLDVRFGYRWSTIEPILEGLELLENLLIFVPEVTERDGYLVARFVLLDFDDLASMKRSTQ